MDDDLLWGGRQVPDPWSEPMVPQIPVELSVGSPLSETVTLTSCDRTTPESSCRLMTRLGGW